MGSRLTTQAGTRDAGSKRIMFYSISQPDFFSRASLIRCVEIICESRSIPDSHVLSKQYVQTPLGYLLSRDGLLNVIEFVHHTQQYYHGPNEFCAQTVLSCPRHINMKREASVKYYSCSECPVHSRLPGWINDANPLQLW